MRSLDSCLRGNDRNLQLQKFKPQAAPHDKKYPLIIDTFAIEVYVKTNNSLHFTGRFGGGSRESFLLSRLNLIWSLPGNVRVSRGGVPQRRFVGLAPIPMRNSGG